MSDPRRYQGRRLGFPIGPKNTNLIEDVKFLLALKLRQIPFSSCRQEVENVKANQRPGDLSWSLNQFEHINWVENVKILFPINFDWYMYLQMSKMAIEKTRFTKLSSCTCINLMLMPLWNMLDDSSNAETNYDILVEYITTLRKGQGNPIRLFMICYPRQGLPNRGYCKSWERGWDSLSLSHYGYWLFFSRAFYFSYTADVNVRLVIQSTTPWQRSLWQRHSFGNVMAP